MGTLKKEKDMDPVAEPRKQITVEMSSSPVLAEKSTSKKKHRDKKKGKSKDKALVQAVASTHEEAHGRNEGVDSNWAYQPPDGMVVLDTSQVDEEFDWDLLKDDEEKELWMVRIPEGFKVKLLDGLEIQQPLKASGAKLSTLERKRAKYDIWSVEQFNNKEQPMEDDEQPPRGEEIMNLSCLLPRKKKHGNFYLAPKQISQHIVVTHSSAIPNVDNGAAPTTSKRYSVPKHLLKHRFLPFGASSTDSIREPTDLMDVDVSNNSVGQEQADHETENLPQTVVQARTPKKKHDQSTATPGKKRKKAEGESETSKHKAKKLKV